MLSRFKQLYRNYASGKIDLTEFLELRELIDIVSDDHIWKVMRENEPEGKIAPMPENLKQTIKTNLRRSVILMRIKSVGRYAAAAVIAFAIVTTVVFGFGKQDAPYQEFATSIPAGSRAEVMLPDRSRVQLNSSSDLAFEWDGHGERLVRLHGEAFFDVAKDANHIFRISVSDIEVEVHGTSFNVSAYDSKKVAVSLASGKVRLAGNGLKGKSYDLKPGEKAVYDRVAGTLTVASADITAETGWTRGDLVFEQKKFSEVIAMIERRYGVDIVVKRDSLADDTLTGTYSNEDLNGVLESLCKIYKFNYTVSKNHITIY